MEGLDSSIGLTSLKDWEIVRLDDGHWVLSILAQRVCVKDSTYILVNANQ